MVKMAKTNTSALSSGYHSQTYMTHPYIDATKIIPLVFAIIVFLILVILGNLLPSDNVRSVTLPNCPSKSIPEYPAIAWHTNTYIFFPKELLLNCDNGTNHFKCAVYSLENAPSYPQAYLFYAHDIDRFPLPRNPETIWGLIQEESPTSKPMLLYEKGLNLFNYSATFSRHSDVPVPLFWLRGLDNINSTKYFVNTSAKNDFLREIAPVLFLQSDCFTFTERETYVEDFMGYIRVDSYGKCLQNKQLPLKYTSYIESLYEDELMRFLARYKFVVTIENAVCDDYVTEKLWRALELGVVPIYYGSPLIKYWLPNNKSALLLEDFSTPQLLSQHIHYLTHNDTAYEEYLEHKTLGKISNQRLIDEMTARPYENDLGSTIKQFQCFLCEKLHDINSPVNIVTKKQYNCPPPISAVTKRVNLENDWLLVIKDHEARVDQVYKEIAESNTTRRDSKTSWFWDHIFE